MAKKSAKRQHPHLKNRESTVSKQNSPSGGWIPAQTGLKIIVLLSVGIGLFGGGQVYWKTHLLDAAVRMGVVLGLSIWVVFAFVLLLTRVLRRRA